MNRKYTFTTILLITTASLFAQVQLIKECGLPYEGAYSYMMTGDGKLFFAADSGEATGLEPWISDGTPGGTHLIKDIYPGISNGLHVNNDNNGKHYMSAFYNHAFYFLGYDAAHGEEIWKYDVATDSIYMLKDINITGNVTGSGSSNLPYFTEMNGILYFAAYTNSNGCELWRTNGNADSTYMVMDIYPGDISSEPKYLTKMGDYIYFSAWGPGTGEEVWQSDGSENGTVLLKDIRPGGYSCFYENSSWRNPHFSVSGSYLYFVANKDTPDVEFHYWGTNGTPSPSGTIRLENTLDVQPNNETEYADVNGTFFFTASDGEPTHSNIYKSNGTIGGTEQVATNYELKANGSFIKFNDALYFNGFDNNGTTYRYGLGRSGGDINNSFLVKSFPSGGSGAQITNMATDGNLLYGRILEEVRPGEMEYRLMQSDGTPEGTTDIPHYGIMGGLTAFNGKMYYAGYDSVIDASYDKPGLYAFTAISVGINKVASTGTVFIYPNPVSDKLTINAKGFTKAEITIADMQGRIIVTKNFLQETMPASLDVSTLGKGCYLLTLRSEGKNEVKKFIKE